MLFTRQSGLAKPFFAALFSALLFSAAFAPLAHAADPVDTVVMIPVSQDLMGNVDATNVHYELRVIEGSPMPDGSVDGVYSFTMSGNAFITIPVTIDHAGVYEYNIVCTEPDTSDADFDNEIRTVRIYAANAVDNSGKVDSVVLFYAADGNKDVKACWTVSEQVVTPSPTIPVTPTTTPTDPTRYSKTGDDFKAGAIMAAVLGSTALFVFAYWRRRDDG